VNIVNISGTSETGVSLTHSIGTDDAYYYAYACDDACNTERCVFPCEVLTSDASGDATLYHVLYYMLNSLLLLGR